MLFGVTVLLYFNYTVVFTFQDLNQHHSLEFLMTRRLNQDPLENLFGLIRQQGGNCDNPSSLPEHFANYL